ncbi:MAG: TerC family protein [Planctomycetaceae bacterium]
MEAVAALLTLTLMEIVLGIDNIIFITILTDRLPEQQQSTARHLGLILAMASRIALLFAVTWLLGLTAPFLSLTSLGISESWLKSISPDHWEQINGVSWRDVILFVGGLFLIRHSVREIHERMEGPRDEEANLAAAKTFTGVLVNITIMDVIFSLDSVITAVAMAKDVWVMVAAIVLSVLVMMMFAGRVSRFVKQHPTLKMLALSFLILIGVMLVAEAIGTHIDKGYIYFAMAFSLVVEGLNIRTRTKDRPAL